MQNKKFLHYAIPILFWGGIWYALSIMINNPLLIPTPASVCKTLLVLFQSKTFWLNVANSFNKITFGFIIGLALGALFACISFQSKLSRLLLNPLMNIIKATPIASVIILLLVWITSKNLSVILVILVVLPNIYNHVLEGLYQADPELLEMAFVYRMKTSRKIRYIYLPKVMEFLAPALSYTIGFSWKAGISGEVLAQPTNSIGEALYYSKIYLDTSSLFAYTLFVIVISMLIEKVLLYIIKNRFVKE